MSQAISKRSSMVIQLRKLINVGWNAIIAGGAVRDTYHDRPVSDIDIFVKEDDKMLSMLGSNYASQKWTDYWKQMFNYTESKNDKIRFFGDGYVFNVLDDDICGVWEIRKGLKKYQIIMLKQDPRDYVSEKFDFGLCRAYCDGRKLHFTNEFLEDSLNKTITLYPENLTKKQIDYAVNHHIQKIRQKYPGWIPVLGVIGNKHKK